MNAAELNLKMQQAEAAHNKTNALYEKVKEHLSTPERREYELKVSQYVEMVDSLGEMKQRMTDPRARENMNLQQAAVLDKMIAFEKEQLNLFSNK